MDGRTLTLFTCISLGILLVIGSGEALQCYECGSLTSTDAKCEDTFKPTGVSKNSCSGSCAKYKGEKDGLQLIWRTCSIVQMKDDCDSKEQMGVDVDVCFCNSNLCNAATTSGFSAVTLLAIILVGVWLIVRQ